MSCTLLVVRHAHAGDREAWVGPDERRPLSKKGRRQAAALVEALDDHRIERVLSSHYVRCLESVVPLACGRRVGIEVHASLAEGASEAQASALVAEVATPGTTVVLCTHGDVVWNLVVGVAGLRDDAPLAKGSTWVMEAGNGKVRAVRYLPPP